VERELRKEADMGLLEQLLGSVFSQGQPSQGQLSPGQVAAGQMSEDQLSGLVRAAIAMLNDPRVGGLQGLAQRFQRGGFGEVLNSWVGTGQNQPIDPGDLSQMLGRDRVNQMSQQAGVPPQQGSSVLAVLLPQIIDRLTPQGQMPQQTQLAQAGATLLKNLLG
jgi:uncharacterized protein YidB (DUF937 family)